MFENIRRLFALLLGFLSREKLVDTCSALKTKDSIFAQALNNLKQFCLHILRGEYV